MKIEKIITTTEKIELEITGATLLSTKEMRMLSINTIPLLSYRYFNYYGCWWLCSTVDGQTDVALVNTDGSIGYTGVFTDNINCVRPALIISNLESSNLEIGDEFIFDDKKFVIISDTKAFCLEDIGCCAFRKNWRADDFNIYETSDVKRFIDEWFEKVKNKEK